MLPPIMKRNARGGRRRRNKPVVGYLSSHRDPSLVTPAISSILVGPVFTGGEERSEKENKHRFFHRCDYVSRPLVQFISDRGKSAESPSSKSRNFTRDVHTLDHTYVLSKHLDEVKSERKQREEGKKIAFPIFTRKIKRFFSSSSCSAREETTLG